MKKAVFTANAPHPVGPYSQGILNNNILFTAGQIAIDPATGTLIEGDIKVHTKQVMENLKAILEAAGMDFSNVVKSTIWLTDMNNFKHVNEVYATYFTSDPPARETLGACTLPLYADLEISMIAMK